MLKLKYFIFCNCTDRDKASWRCSLVVDIEMRHLTILKTPRVLTDPNTIQGSCFMEMRHLTRLKTPFNLTISTRIHTFIFDPKGLTNALQHILDNFKKSVNFYFYLFKELLLPIVWSQ